MYNIAEGFNRGGNKEFYQSLSISLGSTGELRSQTYRAFDYEFINKAESNDIMQRTDNLARKIFKLMQHLKSSDIKGIKYS